MMVTEGRVGEEVKVKLRGGEGGGAVNGRKYIQIKLVLFDECILTYSDCLYLFTSISSTNV